MNNIKVKTRKFPLEPVVQNIFTARQISASDRQCLRSALFSLHSLTVTEQAQIKQVYEELKAGRISIVK
ncbi:MAG: hypothetical protein AB4080_26780 [Trichodesmium sp.]